jgi:hypothetical protein
MTDKQLRAKERPKKKKVTITFIVESKRQLFKLLSEAQFQGIEAVDIKVGKGKMKKRKQEHPTYKLVDEFEGKYGRVK